MDFNRRTIYVHAKKSVISSTRNIFGLFVQSGFIYCVIQLTNVSLLKQTPPHEIEVHKIQNNYMIIINSESYV